MNDPYAFIELKIAFPLPGDDPTKPSQERYLIDAVKRLPIDEQNAPGLERVMLEFLVHLNDFESNMMKGNLPVDPPPINFREDEKKEIGNNEVVMEQEAPSSEYVETAVINPELPIDHGEIV
jgi:hypothetical protein